MSSCTEGSYSLARLLALSFPLAQARLELAVRPNELQALPWFFLLTLHLGLRGYQSLHKPAQPLQWSMLHAPLAPPNACVAQLAQPSLKAGDWSGPETFLWPTDFSRKQPPSPDEKKHGGMWTAFHLYSLHERFHTASMSQAAAAATSKNKIEVDTVSHSYNCCLHSHHPDMLLLGVKRATNFKDISRNIRGVHRCQHSVFCCAEKLLS